MPHSPNSLSLEDAERTSSVDMKAYSQFDAEIICNDTVSMASHADLTTAMSSDSAEL